MRKVPEPGYECWLHYEPIQDRAVRREFEPCCKSIVTLENTPVVMNAAEELRRAFRVMFGCRPGLYTNLSRSHAVVLGTIGGCAVLEGAVTEEERRSAGGDGFVLKRLDTNHYHFFLVAGASEAGVLYGVHELLRRIRNGESLAGTVVSERPAAPLRMIDHWDNLDGTIERGYAGSSILFTSNAVSRDTGRIRDYARLLSSIGINGIVLNNVNVRDRAVRLISDEMLPSVTRLAGIFRPYGIKVFLSVNFASPMRLGGLDTADPLAPEVAAWWRERAEKIYGTIPDFGGFLVKADSEFNPGPYVYGRTHADGANMLAEALSPHGGLVIWRCFVYNCLQDWRDRTTDRAKAAYDNFMPLDGAFADNVVLQIKNGPMDFQVREPVSPLFGAMEKTNQCLELQITQEYTGQQIHLCFLVPQWKEVLGFDTFARGPGSTVAGIASGELFKRPAAGIAGVGNVGDDPFWTGHPLAQANLYGFGRLAWNPELSSERIAGEWTRCTFGADPVVTETVSGMLLESWSVYESYTSPLGIGWMVTPHYHYGPSPDGYEYSKWGTYHRADHTGIGVDRTIGSGTGYTAQYRSPNREIYDSIDRCPEELLLFFHRAEYTRKLSSGKTLIQHIYDTHFEGAERAKAMLERWERLRGRVPEALFERVRERFSEQSAHAKEWRDVINSYFYRKSGIADERKRTIY